MNIICLKKIYLSTAVCIIIIIIIMCFWQKWLPIIRMISRYFVCHSNRCYGGFFFTQVNMFSSLKHICHHFFPIPLRVLRLSLICFPYVRRKLRNPRNRLHMHLFASFIMRAFMALLKDWSFIDGIGLAWDVVFVDGKSAFIREHNVKWRSTQLFYYFNFY